MGLVDTASTPAEYRYRRQRIERWSQPRYALDQRFVRLSLLVDQGEEAQGVRWRESRQFHDLREVLAEVQEPAIVLLGPPGSGKSTLLRHYELWCCRAALANRAEEASDENPLTLFSRSTTTSRSAPMDRSRARWTGWPRVGRPSTRCCHHYQRCFVKGG